jgi:transcriptional regulator GlxA family with amidase domain
VGAMTTEFRFHHLPDANLCGLRFRPGMAREFFRIPAGRLTDPAIPLDDVLGSGARELERRLQDAGSTPEGARVLAAWLRPPVSTPNPVQRAILELTDARGNADLDVICAHANLSPRQFRRRCIEESGLSPKHLCRILRFRYALQLGRQLVTEAARDWAGVAAGAGYFDQAHLIRDFREFTGRTPMAVFSNSPGALIP